ncbi:MAG TPA: hypothetical protein VGG62_02035 [Terracidiphilus sp.]
MRFWTLLLILVVISFFSSMQTTAEESPERNSTEAVVSPSPLKVTMEPGSPVKTADGCAASEIEPNSMSPTWDTQAETTPCGALETDNLLTRQPLGRGIWQQTMTTTLKYGLTPRLEVRWVPPGRISQAGGGTSPMGGTTDQWVGALYRFRDQGRWTPDLAFDYAFKIPTANPNKGFGSDYADHQLTFIASRDRGPNHLDFNVAGTIAGAATGSDAAAQFGMAYTRSFSSRLMATIEAFGGPQPGTSDRYGAVLAGGSWSIRPWLAVNGGLIHTYTAGSPRQQYLIGFIYSIRPRFAPSRESWLMRAFGR